MIRIALALAIALTPAIASAIDVGDKCPNFSFKDSSGKEYSLASFHQKVLLLWYEGAKSKEQNRRFKNILKKARQKGILNDAWYRSVGVANFQEHWAADWMISKVIKGEVAKTGALILEDRNGWMKSNYGAYNGRSNIFLCVRQADGSYKLKDKQSGKMTKDRIKGMLRAIIRLRAQ